MDEMLKIQASINERPSSLRFVYDKISVHIRGLASLGISSNSYGSLLIPIIMQKLPQEIRLEIARISTSDVWKIQELLDTIKKEIEAREASEEVQTRDSRNRNPKPPIPATAKALFTKDTKENGKFLIRIARGNTILLLVPKLRNQKTARTV